jgi:tRNA 2-thiouridine synthesizing protein A
VPKPSLESATLAGMNTETADAQATPDRELDVRGLNCPLPILRAKKTLGELASGQHLKVLATDPGSVKDFAAFCKQTGHILVLSQPVGKEFHFILRKL